MGKKKNEANVLETVRTELNEQSRNVWLAGLGALATVEEEGNKLYDSFVKRGESLVKRGEDFEKRRSDEVKQLVSAFNEQQEALGKQFTDTTDELTKAGTDAEQTVVTAVTDALERIGVPTRRRVRDLADKVQDLAQKVERLTLALERGVAPADTRETRTTFMVSPDEEGWKVQLVDSDSTPEIFETKKAAVEAGRKMAKAHAPSELIVQKKDGTIQESFTYDAEA